VRALTAAERSNIRDRPVGATQPAPGVRIPAAPPRSPAERLSPRERPASGRPGSNGRSPEAAAASQRSITTPERILQRLDWTVIRRLDGLLQGDYRSLFRGNGVDLAGLREYQPGDDVRYIDWNVTARMDDAYVREYNEDREITAWFLLDLSPSVDFGTLETERLKRTVLTDFVATLSRLLTRRGNRVGAIFFGQGISHIPARGGRDQVLHLIDSLLRQPRVEGTGLTDLAPLLAAGENTIKRRSLVFVISDFISVPGWDRPLSMMNRRHEVVAVRLLDPREIELPDAGPLILEDAETGEQIYVDTHDRGFRKRFAEAAAAREAAIAGSFRRAGVESVSMSTDDDLVRSIVRMATLRSRRGRR
jgi:uncharacterized protein (DUF58 family)